MPMNTLRRIHVVVPAKAEFEAGFFRWVNRLSRMAGILGCRVIFHTHARTQEILSRYMTTYFAKIRTEYVLSTGNHELKRMAGEVNDDHLLVVVCARKDSISYRPAFEHIPEQIETYHPKVSLMLIFPDEYAEDKESPSLFAPHTTSIHRGYETHKGWLSEMMEKWKRIKN
jgi:hypothetical protein